MITGVGTRNLGDFVHIRKLMYVKLEESKIAVYAFQLIY